ncbi:MAG TPA: hypothetical protein ENK49_10695 [Gammaproteobacteria bacterium]|nr:hypothetical protein [Gammaproteobacteria bacterium]
MRRWNVRVRGLFSVALMLAGIALPPGGLAAEKELQYKISAAQARLIRKVTGTVISEVQGVPAEPVDSLVFDGVGVERIRGRLRARLDPVSNTGHIEARWKDRHGIWRYHQDVFVNLPFPTGLRIGPSATQTELIGPVDPVVINVYKQGDTQAGPPFTPTTFTLLAAWGPARVSLNGRPFDNPFDGPAPLWSGRLVVREGVRDEKDNSVRNLDGSIFAMSDPSRGRVDHHDLEADLFFMDGLDLSPNTNFPPTNSFFYHLVFEKVEIEIGH